MTEYLCSFPKFQAPNTKMYILITHESDDSVPIGLCGNESVKILGDPYLINWYATNADYSHSKLTNIPIGMALDYLPYGNVTTMQRAVENYNDPDHLTPTWFVSGDLYEAFLREMGNSRFVLSPRGRGIDCYRTWEAIIMGSIPIVPDTVIRDVYKNERVLIMDDLTNNFTPRRYLTLEANGGRLGNQLFRVLSGFGIAKTLNRVNNFWVPSNYIPHVEPLRQQLEQIFPLLNSSYIISDIDDNGYPDFIKYGYYKGDWTCCIYESPEK
ncbi:hypothetical protein WR25_06082 [Diploscapter pachys]|uniref:RXYLT1 C-terminal domain-containing protein n=1 Tax=Diploscapter pachys TaxID=2018661 RepID=A0A2A2LNM0_9BILA|nr:hypothetical protein WR25_06082 [Diploscapter pachys]